MSQQEYQYTTEDHIGNLPRAYSIIKQAAKTLGIPFPKDVVANAIEFYSTTVGRMTMKSWKQRIWDDATNDLQAEDFIAEKLREVACACLFIAAQSRKMPLAIPLIIYSEGFGLQESEMAEAFWRTCLTLRKKFHLPLPMYDGRSECMDTMRKLENLTLVSKALKA